MKPFRLLISFFLLFSISLQAQIEQIFAAKEDAQTYLNHYISPAMNGLMYNLNNNWYTTGKVHKTWGFDLTISGTASMIPQSDKTFVFNANEYNNLAILQGSNELPTVGGENASTRLIVSDNHGNSFDFDAPAGIGKEWPDNFIIPVSIPSPMIQVGVGIPGNTDVKLRYVPKISPEEVSFELYGIGVQHDLTQYLKIVDKIPGLSISALGAYTHARLVYSPQDSPVDGSDQSMEMSVNAYTIQGIGDFDLKIVNFYLGIGYAYGTTNLDVLGTYQYDFDDNGSYSTEETLVDPLQMQFDLNGFKATAGVRFHLGPVKLFADYTLQKYSSISTGLAISIR